MSKDPLRLGAVLLLAVAVLHGIAVIASGFSDEALRGLTCAALALGVGAGLWRGWRWLGWLVLLALPVTIALTAARLGLSTIPDYLLWAVILVETLAAVALFVALWRARVPIG